MPQRAAALSPANEWSAGGLAPHCAGPLSHHCAREVAWWCTDDMIVLRGVNLFPTQIEELILGIDGLSAQFQCVLDRPDRLDQLTLRVESRPGLGADLLVGASLALTEQITNCIGVRVLVEVLHPGGGPGATIWPRIWVIGYLYAVNAVRGAPGSQASLREANRDRVLDVIRGHGAMTQVEIADLSGLSPATVSNVVRGLGAAGAVALSPSIRNGRRAVLVSLASGGGLLAGITFGDRDVRVAVGSGAREILGQQRMPLPADHQADEGMERAARLLADLVDGVGGSLSDIDAVGFGLPAPVDSVTGQVGSEDILRGWRGVNVAEALEARLKAPVILDNTANLAALGELRSGALRGVRHGCYVKVSYGVGAGIVIDGEIFRGSAGTAGEIGHLTIDEDGPICRCGNRGCLDTFVGARAILGALAASHGPLRLGDVITRAMAGDAGCRRVLEDAGRHLGVAVAGLVNLLNPEVVVLGGQMARVGDLVLAPLREAVDRCAIPSAAATVRLRTAELGESADVLGAIMAASVLHGSASNTG
jgi:predicted NBD/HSP70 family sugar kinase